jgi:hypothetical protein
MDVLMGLVLYFINYNRNTSSRKIYVTLTAFHPKLTLGGLKPAGASSTGPEQSRRLSFFRNTI